MSCKAIKSPEFNSPRGSNPASFCLFSFYSQHNYDYITINGKK